MLKRCAKAVYRSTVSPLADLAGIYDRRLRRLAQQPHGGWTVLMYHRVVADRAADPFALGMCVRRAHFESQIAYVRRHFELIGVGDAVARLQRGEPLPPRALSVTFDDGYLDNLQVALPVLEAHRVPFTVYVPTGGLEEGTLMWWDRAIAALAGATRAELDTDAVGLPGMNRRLPLSSWYRAASAQSVLAHLWTLPIGQALEVVARLERLLGTSRAVAEAARRMLPAQLRELQRRGGEIGAHSVSHPNLRLLSAGETLDEMLDSRRTLQELCQNPVEGFAYPGGQLGGATVQAARAAGFRHAVTTVGRVNRAGCDLLQIGRVGMPDTPVADFKRALSARLLRAAGEPVAA